ncbi:MAG: U32 family peptidase, partial [Planctomycetota bacterium]
QFVKQLPLEQIHAFRILDPGVALWFCEQAFPCELQLLCDSGNHNLTGLQEWAKIFAPRLTRLILSSEIPGDSLKSWIPQIPASCEILGLGPILLFYTPRKLLSPHFKHPVEEEPDSMQEEIRATACAEESQNRSFLTVETQQGTFIYNPKDLCLLEYISELGSIELHYLRLDRYDVPSLPICHKIMEMLKHPSLEHFQQIRQLWKRPLIHGFYSGNRSDSTFDQLKNGLFKNRKEQVVGEIMDVKRKDYLVIQAHQEIQTGESFCFSSPDGTQKVFQIEKLHSSSGKKIQFLKKGEIGILPWYSHVYTSTLILRNN